jgi:hypothetical protein
MLLNLKMKEVFFGLLLELKEQMVRVMLFGLMK